MTGFLGLAQKIYWQELRRSLPPLPLLLRQHLLWLLLPRQPHLLLQPLTL